MSLKVLVAVVMVHTALLPEVACHVPVHPIDSSENCSVAYTHHSGYRMFFPIRDSDIHDGEVIFRFGALTDANAIILLLPERLQEESKVQYEIVLGANQNAYAAIRRIPSWSKTFFDKEIHISQIVSASKMHTFLIHAYPNGTITVEREHLGVFLRYRDPDPVPIHFFSFSSFGEYKATWKYNCVSTPKVEPEASTVKPEVSIEKPKASTVEPIAFGNMVRLTQQEINKTDHSSRSDTAGLQVQSSFTLLQCASGVLCFYILAIISVYLRLPSYFKNNKFSVCSTAQAPLEIHGDGLRTESLALKSPT